MFAGLDLSLEFETVQDLSAYIISGAVSAVQGDADYESDERTPAQGIADPVEAKRINFAPLTAKRTRDASTVSQPGLVVA